MKYDVFIWSKSEDYSKAELLSDFLRRNGLHPFLASESLRRVGNTAYLDEIDNNGPKLEKTFQSTLNKGFSDIYTLTAVTSVIALAVLAFYKWKRKKA